MFLKHNTFTFQLSYNKSKQMQYNSLEGLIDETICGGGGHNLQKNCRTVES